MIKVGNKSKIEITWDVLPMDFSREKESNIIAKFSKKYGIPKDSIKVEPNFIMINKNGEKISLTNDVIENIQDPKFQVKLFEEYITLNNIKDCDFEQILSIDNEINGKIDYEVYDKFRRYSVKWIKWDNFLSYGSGNYFDFTQLKGLVLLNGEPANQSGKTTFAIDLLHFLLFGKTSKSSSLDKVFNKHLPEETEVIVEGCLEIDGVDYIIKRTLTRTSLKKRTEKSKTTQKIEYYKKIGDNLEELSEYMPETQNCEEETVTKTNKIIKEAIGSEKDFDLIICATGNNLDDLIEIKETERGRLLSKWIGLLPLEEKDKIAREKFNKEVMPKLFSSKYNRETLTQEISDLKLAIENDNNKLNEYKKELSDIEKSISSLESDKERLLVSKKPVDESLKILDINTVNNKLERLKQEGTAKKNKLKVCEDEFKTVENIDFSDDEYETLILEDKRLAIEQSEIRNEIKNLKQINDNLKNSEYCQLCKRKFEDIDNSKTIEENNSKIDELIKKGVENKALIDEIEKKKEKMLEIKSLFKKKNDLSVLIPKITVDISNLRIEYKDTQKQLDDYNRNKDIIDINNSIDINVNNLTIRLRTERSRKDSLFQIIEACKNEVSVYSNTIKEKEKLITTIELEEKLVKNWKIYLEMIGKNGISKMVLRNTLPLINAELSRLLNGVCDFTVEIVVTEKNDVMFYLIKDGVKSDLNSGSGFERTASALALRAVLGNISTMPRPNFIVFDEILGKVARENYDNMKLLYDKILKNYNCIIQISHLDEIKDWHDIIVTITKESNVSRICVKK